MENHFYHIRRPPLNVTNFITHVGNCEMGAMPMGPIVTPWVVGEIKTNEIINKDLYLYSGWCPIFCDVRSTPYIVTYIL